MKQAAFGNFQVRIVDDPSDTKLRLEEAFRRRVEAMRGGGGEGDSFVREESARYLSDSHVQAETLTGEIGCTLAVTSA